MIHKGQGVLYSQLAGLYTADGMLLLWASSINMLCVDCVFLGLSVP